MDLLLRVLIALALNYALAIAAWWAMPRLSHRMGVALAIGLSLPCTFVALIVPADFMPVRCIAVLGAVNGTRICSYAIENQSASLAEYLRFISFCMLRPYLIFTRKVNHHRPRVGREILRLIAGAAIIPPTWMLAWHAIVQIVGERSWIVNHLIVLAAFVIILTCVGQILLAVWRLQGLPVARPIFDNILASRTPAEFWRRESWPPHLALHRYIYRPAGGSKHHIRATLAAFLASGVAHDLLFAAATGRFTGHQTIFFMLNGVGVLASPGLERLAAALGSAGRAMMRTLTILFLIACSPFFFASVDEVFPLYMKSIWLMW